MFTKVSIIIHFILLLGYDKNPSQSIKYNTKERQREKDSAEFSPCSEQRKGKGRIGERD